MKAGFEIATVVELGSAALAGEAAESPRISSISSAITPLKPTRATDINP